jgi:LPS-assembly protein
VASNWVVSGGARWDLATNQINQYTVGAGYVDDCFVLALNYITAYNYAYSTATPTLNHTVMLQLGLRTIGMFALSQNVSADSSGSGLFGQ